MRLRILCKIFWWISHFNSRVSNFEVTSRFGDLWINGKHIINIEQVFALDNKDLIDFFEDFMKCCVASITENTYKGI